MLITAINYGILRISLDKVCNTYFVVSVKLRRGPAKKDPIVHDAMEILLTEGMAKLYEKMDELNV